MINFYHIYENCFVCTSNKMSDGSKRQKKTADGMLIYKRNILPLASFCFKNTIQKEANILVSLYTFTSPQNRPEYEMY